MITANNLNVVHGTAQDKALLNEALAYLQQSPLAVPYLQKLVDQRIAIWIVHTGDLDAKNNVLVTKTIPPQPPAYPTDIIFWDPAYVTNVDSDIPLRQTPGSMSPALALLHEAMHAVDPLTFTKSYQDSIAAYDTKSEKIVIDQENVVAPQLHELVRHNHHGYVSYANNPSEHVQKLYDLSNAHVIEEIKYWSSFGDSQAVVSNNTIDSNVDGQYIATAETVVASGAKFLKIEYQAAQRIQTDDFIIPYGQSALKYGSGVLALTGSTRLGSGGVQWMDSSGTYYNLQGGNFGTDYADLLITKGAVGAGAIEIQHFDVFAAETLAYGFFGIKLQGAIKITSKNLTFTLSIDGASTSLQEFHVSMSGAFASDFLVATGGFNRSMSTDGGFDISLKPGEASATFTLIDVTGGNPNSDIARGAQLVLTATISDEDHPGGPTLTSGAYVSPYVPSRPSNGHTPKNTHDIQGNSGNYVGDGGNDQVMAAFLDNKIDLRSSVNDNIVSGLGSNVINGGSGNNVITLSGTSNDVTLGSGHSTVNGAPSGHDTIRAPGQASLVNARNGTDVILAGSGTNQIYADSQVALDAAIAASSPGPTHQKGDLISVLDGYDTIVGGLGDDLINSGNGHAEVILGPGQDTFIGGWEVTGALASWHTQTDADGVLQLFDVTGSVETFANSFAQPYNGNTVIEGNSTLQASASNATVFGGSGNDLIVLGNGSNYAQAGSGNTTIYGGMGNDMLVAGSGTDYVRGGGGNTNIQGGSGTSTLDGGDGNNTIIGGSGNATIAAAAAAPSITVGGRWTGDTLSNNYVFTGGGDDLVFGSAGSDTLIGGSGNVTLQGGLGFEYMIGGSGKSLLIAGVGNDTLVAGSGDATLQGGGSATTQSWMYGGDGTDLIMGGSGQNVLYAGDGGTSDKKTTVSSSLTDAGSKTTIYGGMGVDWLQSGVGTTVINVGDGGTDSAPTTVVAGSGATTVNGGAGVDFINGGSGTSVLNAGDGGTSDAATTVIGGSGKSTLVGGAGAALLGDASSGQDVLIAGSGDDTLVGFGADTYVGGQGSAIVQNEGGHATVNLGTETGSTAVYNFTGGTTNLVLGGGITAANIAASVAFDSIGGSFLTMDMSTGAVSIRGALTGSLAGTTFDSGAVSMPALMTTLFQSDQAFSNGSNTLFVDVAAGESAAQGTGGDTVSAWGANDTLTASANQLVYAAGAGTLVRGGLLGDLIVAAGDQDTVIAGTYGSSVTLSGANSLATNPLGNSALTASGTGDTLVGGVGSTQFYVNDSTTTIVDSNPTGQDAVWSTVNFTLPTSVALTTLTLTGTANIVGTGNNGNDVLTGGAGQDTLVAGSGIATLVGGSNATTFVVNSTSDKVVENNAANVDTLVSSVNATLPTNVNFVSLTGGAALTATANAGRDTLVSNTGVDTLYGGGGGDLFIINNAADVIVEAAGATNDTLETAYGMTLPSNVNTLVLTGSAALQATANNGDDTLVSNSGIDTLVGGAGNDTFVVNNVLDVVKGASATSHNAIIASVNVTLPTNVNTLTLTGTVNLQVSGNSAADLITANSGNDTLTALSTTVASTLVGGSGNDTFVVNNKADVVLVASTTSNDTIQSSADFTAVANVNTLVLTGTANLKATANDAGDTLVSNTGVDMLTGGAGNDVFVINNAADVLVNVGPGDTVISYVGGAMPANVANLVLGGSANLQATTNGGNVQLTGNAGADTLVATSGQDTLVAGTGVDTLVAGTGNDLFVVDNASDVVSLSGAHGIDTLQSSLSWTLQNGINMLVLTGTANLTGHAVSGNNRINANAGSDTLYAGSGNDTLSAQGGPATLVGGSGTDTFIISNSADVIQNISAAGNTVYSSVSYAMQAGVAVLDLFGGADVSATGNATADTIVGNFGNDTLTAGAGAALLEGGMGADLFIVNSINDVVVQGNYGQKGTADTIQSSIGYTLPGTVDNLVLTGTADLKAIGNQNADVIVGNSGKDTLVAGQGDDTLISGSGVTLLQGGPGNDTYVVNNALDTVTTSAADSYNVLMSSVTYVMPANISELVLTGSDSIKGTSNGLDVSMTAGDGADTLVATTGQDTLAAGNGLVTMVGGTGNDTFVVNNSADVVTDSTTGKNNVVLASASFVLPANVETLTLTGSGDISATGNGDGRVDTLNAGYGNDTLFAGSDAAILNGGAGSTTFVVNSINDVVQNADPTQANSLQSSVTYTLPTNVNLLTLTGSSAITGTGNSGADTLIANSGVDTLVSGSGNDLFILGNVNDKVTNAFTANADTIQSSYNVTLPVNVNTLLLTGSDALTGTANGGNDTLVSNAGADTLTGGAGNDTFIVNNASDVVNGASASTNNAIVASVNFTLPTNVNTLVLTGTADLQASGNAGADLIVANDGNDTLTALSTVQATTLVGGIGNDVFVVNNTADVVQVGSTTSLDTIQSSANFTAAANVNTLVLTGTANLQATANGAGDTLVSNSGVDTLVGGTGNDVFVVNNAADVLVNLSAGDTVESSVAFTSLTTPGVTLVLLGAANLAVAASGDSDVLVAGDGDDTLTANGTNETLYSGAGNDLFIVNDPSDVVAETVDGGMHSIQSSVSYALPDYIDTLTLTGPNNAVARGNDDYDNVLTAGSGNDTLIGTAYNNTLTGGAGVDRIDAGPGTNVIHAGSGGTAFGYTYVYGANDGGGTAVSDVIYGDTGVNVLQGGAGNNTIVGGAGTTHITAIGLNNVVTLGASGTPSQPLVVDLTGGSSNSQTTVTGGTGAAVIYAGGGTDVISAGTGSTTINAGYGAESIYGHDGTVATDSQSGQSLLVAGGGTELMTGYGHDTMVAGSGTTTFRSDRNSNITYVVPATLGNTTIQNLANYVDPYAVPVPSTESLVFGAGISPSSITYDMAIGTTFDIFLVLKEGTGSIAIGSGADIGTITGITFTDSGTTESLKQLMNSMGVTSASTYNGSYKINTGNGQLLDASNFSFDLWAFGDNDTIFQSSNGAVTAYGDNDTLTGSTFLVGGNNNLLTLDPGNGYAAIYGAQDTVVAGAGVNKLVIRNSSAVIQAAVGGTNQIDATVSFTLPANVQTLLMDSTVGGLVGTSNNQGGQLIAAANADTLRGGAGADTLSAQGINDVLIGGAGAETYIINDASDVIQYGSGAASLNSVQSKSSFALTANANTLVETGNYVVGTGNSANDTLTAAGIWDTLVAGSGNTTLIEKGTGPAVLVGGTGNDTFIVNNQSDVVQEASTTTSSTIQSAVNFTLPANVNTLLLTGGTVGRGNSGNDWLSSSGMSGTLVAGSGTDTLVGGSGMTTFVFNTGFGHDQVLNVQNGDVLQFGPGINRTNLTFSALQGAVGTAPSLVVTNAAGGSVTLQGGLVPGAISSVMFGDGTTSGIPALVAPTGHSTLAGAHGNLIISTADNDVLVGGSGQDTILAWGSNDTLSAGSGGALIFDAGSPSKLTGSSGADTLTALGAGSTLVGGTGSEVFVVSDSSTAISVAAANGHDTIVSSASYTLPANVAVLTLTGTADLQATGNSLADTITANAGNDVLTAGTGLATLIGGAGHDTFIVNNTGDVVQVPFTKPYDSIQSSASYTLPVGVNDLFLTSNGIKGTTNGQGDFISSYGTTDTLVATSGNNLLQANSQNNDLLGGSGFDTLISYGGSNRLFGGSGITGFQSTSYDTVYINNSADYFIGAVGQGDALHTSVNYRLTAAASNWFYWILDGTANLVADDENPEAQVTILANAGNDTLMAVGAADLVGGTGIDTFIGAGLDTYEVTNIADVIQDSGTQSQIVAHVNFTLPGNINTMQLASAGIVGTANSGNDTLSVSGSTNDTIIAGAGNDLLTTSSNGSNTLVAGTGRDTLDSEGANDVFLLNAGFGQVEARTPLSTNPLIKFGPGFAMGSLTASAIFDSAGKAALKIASGTGAVTLDGALAGTSYQVQVGSGAVMSLAQFLTQVPIASSTLVGGSGNLILNSQASASFTTGAGSDSLFAAGANDTLIAGAGTQLLGAYGANSSVVGGSGLDTLQAYGAGDTLTGGTGANLLQAFGNNDVIAGGAAPDTMVGADGANVTFVVNNASDVVQATYYAGVDTIRSSIDYWLQDYVNILVLTGGNALRGQGNYANDTLVSNTGVDTLIGGTASDLFVLNNALDVVSVGSVHGTDTIQTSFNDTLAANVQVLVLAPAGSLMGTGNSLADTLKANDSGDTLVAGSGAATMIGGAGNDLFMVNNTADSVQSAGGNDTISSLATFTLPTNVNTLVMTGGNNIKGTGNSANDLLTAVGTSGKVTLVAGSGTDTLVSGNSVDSLVGGAGNDLFIINNAADVVTVTATSVSDTIQSAFNDTLVSNVNTLVLTGSGAITGAANTAADRIDATGTTGAVTLVGGAGADTLLAGSGADVLKAGAGITSMIGGAGNDLFYVTKTSDAVVNSSTTNADTISSSAPSYTLPNNVNRLVLTASGISGTGNAAADLITAAGTTGAETLTAGAGSAADTLVAGNGANVLNSNSGVDSLVGGTGADLFVLNNAGDIVTVGATHGVDTIQASFNDTLAANVQVLVLAPTGALTGTGNSLADTLKANDYGDTLVAGTGAATMIGGAGNDLFMINSASDSVQSAAGNDTISSTATFTLPANVNTLVMTGTNSMKGAGNTADDLLTAVGTSGKVTLVAGNGTDTLVSGNGADSLVGGSGNDLFIVNSAATIVFDSIAGGADTIQSSFTTTLLANEQTLVLTGSAAITGTGNTATSLIIGGTGAQTLAGGTGLAVLEAGTAGAQVLKAASNQAALIGGGAANTLTGGAYKDFFAAGKVGDAVTTGATANVIAYNKGDGALVIAPTTSANNVLSLGAGIDTEALTFTKSGNNLVLNDGVSGDSITFTNWFAATANQTTTKLQVIEAASASYNGSGTDVLRNKPIEEFNFTTLVANFTTAGNPANWQLSQKEGADTIASSATSAYGGDLAYYYGKNGNLTGMNVSATQSTLTNASYATALQTIDAWASISGGATTMSVVAGGSSAAATPAADGKETTGPVSRAGMMQAAYVTQNQLAAVRQEEGGSPEVVSSNDDRNRFGDLWAAMHRQLDVSQASGSTIGGAELHGVDLVPDVVAMLSGAGTSHLAAPNRKIAVPGAGLHERLA